VIWSVPCGDYTIYAIEDGYALRNPLEHFTQSSEDDWEAHELEEDGGLRLRYGCFLLAAADHRILVDAGMGTHRTGDFVAGQTLGALETLGIGPETIEMVIQTHMHFDHIGGTLSEERAAVFPNARHVHHTTEWEHWSKAESPGGEAARWIMEPLLDEGLVDFIDEDLIVGDGVEAVPTPGHTPGHVSVRVKSGSTEVLIGGDLSNQPIQTRHPEYNLPFDIDHDMATATRRRAFEELSGSGILFLAGHYPAPGIGVIEPLGSEHRFVPLELDDPIALRRDP